LSKISLTRKFKMKLILILIFQILFVFIEIDAGDSKSSSLMTKFQDSEKSVGRRGPPGLRGRDGRDGRDAFLCGSPGNQGPQGDAGGSTGGVVYTRWGRKICPTSKNTTLLYSGFMAGSHYTHSGGGSNYLCLPKDPIYDKTNSGFQKTSYIYGTEFQVASQRNIFPTNVQNHDAPCAVCHTESRGSHVMIPARNICPSGWTLEYKGYLMAAKYTHKGRTQYICVDDNPTATLGTHANLNGALLYFVEGRCGSLPCGPYVAGNELTCVVCTK
ncbi:hypothetical protein, partial [Salmonella sp. s54412]|uniref:hypothetical protein n=1 Tax=Salmonella sp. s54412 TaxID=3160128 RepID=UPI003754B544